MKTFFLFFMALSAALISPVTIASDVVHIDFIAAGLCRSRSDDTERLACYDAAVTPTKTRTFDKYENSGQCRDEAWVGKRLACYDRFFSPTFAGAHHSGAGDSKRVDSGQWKTSISTSPIDDSKNVLVAVDADEPFTSPYGEPTTPTLVVACREKKTQAFIDWGVYLGLDETTMIHRIDKRKAVTRSWYISTGSTAVLYSGNTIDFIKNLGSGDMLFAQIVPYGEDSISATFNLGGLSEALKPLQKSCGWK
ncbi:TPA: type VI secretion protein [Enterobacter ludwigii]|nr:type VI secretion protein [Enterobacter ludwigii]HDR2591073.1 type VI secretion protein [Enterobacter ludwigii]HDR2598732.1 type VI secretion protein [Enterobacter ludwigii]